jgi:hypothetical protein
MPPDKKHILYLDDFMEELFHILVLESDEGMSHTCTIIAKDREEASKILCKRLEKYVANNFEEVKDD